ncbi:serine/threonine-protein kinase HT1-like [Hibiscus syriacus]|uniref:Serine/threonine-protein kinase HT1-like n=1 Tax=Hibiscus syriacus TaxID=106335 RepID=A0A6A2WFN1_HIBSY|nr:transcription factor bHLH162-like [Hibiscus syriacus]KAE8656401.1 serine/threonine-protein kinase HT1-like [Hibiscus syriacus]
MENNPNDSSRQDRKLIERNRRTHMKALCSELHSLLPHHKPREPTTLPDQLQEAAKYIKKLQTKLERMKEKRYSLMGVKRWKNTASGRSNEPKSPEIQIHEMGSSLVIGLTTDTDSSRFIFNHTIRILHEEGAEIANASFSVVDDAAFHTIHLTIGHESAPDYEAAARISERLNKFVDDADA